MPEDRPQFIQGNPKFGGKKKINKQIKKLNKQSRKIEKQLMRSINNPQSVRRAFNRAAERKAPIADQIKNAAAAYSDVEDPAVRSQLIRGAEQNIRGNRENQRALAVQDFANKLAGKAQVYGMKQNRLGTLLNERNTSRGLAAQEYLGQLQQNQALEGMQRQKAAGLEFFGDAPGQYFLRTGETSPAASSPWSTVVGPNDQLYTINRQTGDVTAPSDPLTGDPIVKKSFLEELQGLTNK